MRLNEDKWTRLDGKPVSIGMTIIADDRADAGTTEELLLDVGTGKVYRRRSWSQSRYAGPAGEVWFALKTEV